jgi:hypothetical protein
MCRRFFNFSPAYVLDATKKTKKRLSPTDCRILEFFSGRS